MNKQVISKRDLEIIETITNLALLDHSYLNPAYRSAGIEMEELMELREKVRKM